jgi:hypothetical protein
MLMMTRACGTGPVELRGYTATATKLQLMTQPNPSYPGQYNYTDTYTKR